LPQEIDFILETAAQYLHKAPTRADVLSVFAGIRPLVSAAHAGNTAALSRDHTIRIDESGLLSIAGGKWTTYRRMAEDCINQAATLAGLEEKPAITEHLKIHGFQMPGNKSDQLAAYGSDSPAIRDLIKADSSLGDPLHPELNYIAAEVIWAVRMEMARTVEDVLARRTRALFLNSKAASEAAPRVATIMARELDRAENWRRDQVRTMQELARGYQTS
jgi:glycerol-3-phosphate dehydrogenase